MHGKNKTFCCFVSFLVTLFFSPFFFPFSTLYFYIAAYYVFLDISLPVLYKHHPFIEGRTKIKTNLSNSAETTKAKLGYLAFNPFMVWIVYWKSIEELERNQSLYYLYCTICIWTHFSSLRGKCKTIHLTDETGASLSFYLFQTLLTIEVCPTPSPLPTMVNKTIAILPRCEASLHL